MNKEYKWGILGTGYMAHQFLLGIRKTTAPIVWGVGGMNQEVATEFAEENNIPNAFGTYEGLMDCEEVDIIYVATVQIFHFENVKYALERGKHVICEKTLMMNEQQARELQALAKEKKVLFQEAMWARFLPATKAIKDMLQSGVIGKIKNAMLDFGYEAVKDPEGRIYNPKLGGGAIYDAGIYPTSFASYIMERQPDEIVTVFHNTQRGVNVSCATNFKYDDILFSIYFSVANKTLQQGIICAEKGTMVIPRFWSPCEFTVITQEKTTTYQYPYIDNGYYYIAQSFVDTLLSGKLDNDIMPLEESCQIMNTIDRIQASWES